MSVLIGHMENDDLTQIDRLHALKERGALSQEEFLAEKAKILDDNAEVTDFNEIISSNKEDPVTSEASNSEWAVEPVSSYDVGSRVPFVVGIAMAIVFLGGGFFFWRQNAETIVTEASTAARTEKLLPKAQASNLPMELSEAQLLKEAFSVTFAKQATGYKAEKLVAISQTVYAVLASAEGGESHADTGRFGVQYAQRLGDNFSPVGPLREIETGSFGQISSWRIISDSASAPLVIVEGGGTWQGCTSAEATIFELAPNAPVILGSVPVAYSFEDAEGIITEYEGIVEQGAQGLQVRYTGSLEMFIPLRISGGSMLRPTLPLPKAC